VAVDALTVSFRPARSALWVAHSRAHDDGYETIWLPRDVELPAILRSGRHMTAFLSLDSTLAHADLIAARSAKRPVHVINGRVERLVDAAVADLAVAAARRQDMPLSQRLLAERVRIDSSAAASRSHTSRVFTRATGMTLSRYRQRMRVVAAVRAIASRDDSLATIAAETGFANQAHLSRSLVGATGSTPTSLRRRFHTGSPVSAGSGELDPV